jgi:hypothetical protein
MIAAPLTSFNLKRYRSVSGIVIESKFSQLQVFTEILTLEFGGAELRVLLAVSYFMSNIGQALHRARIVLAFAEIDSVTFGVRERIPNYIAWNPCLHSNLVQVKTGEIRAEPILHTW